jgi:hypothetical protein
MSDKQTGGPAFPVPAELCQDLTVEQQRGMTLRDYFAAKAMEGDLTEGRHEDQFAWCAKRAYKMADEMLKARDTHAHG